MADLETITVPVDGGTNLDAVAVSADSDGDTAETGERVFLAVANGSAGTRTVTVATPGNVSGLAIADATLSVGAGGVGVLPLPRLFAGSDGRASVSYDDATDITVAVLRLAG